MWLSARPCSRNSRNQWLEIALRAAPTRDAPHATVAVPDTVEGRDAIADHHDGQRRISGHIVALSATRRAPSAAVNQ